MMWLSELLSTGPETVVLNANAVYVTAYSVLHLTMTLRRSSYFTSSEKSLPLSEVPAVCLRHGPTFTVHTGIPVGKYTRHLLVNGNMKQLLPAKCLFNRLRHFWHNLNEISQQSARCW